VRRFKIPIGSKVYGRELFFVLGPCVIENEKFLFRMARRIRTICEDLEVPFLFKASYDKANRTSIRSFRGMDIEDGCKMLAAAAAEAGVPATTDVHLPREAELAAQHIDLLQIPAFLCRQTDLITACAATGRPVNVKKGQFLAPWDVRPIAEKLKAAGCRHFLFTERGTTFGYNNLVADMRSLPLMREQGYPVIFDATHSVQRPGGGGDTTSGDGALAPVLADAAVAAGCDAIFIETHENPAKALSDGPNQIPLSRLPKVLRRLKALAAVPR
jgi:2-dehydro-3-deoxyphosphooctonate aldolase (KDO 8-P synthase)